MKVRGRPDRYDRAGLPRLVVFHLEGVPETGSAELLEYLRAAGTRVGWVADLAEDRLRRELAAASTRDAVLVGGTAADAMAAAASGIPFVRLARETEDGGLPADATVRSDAEVLDRLRGRSRLLQRLEVLLEGAARIGVTGPAGVGKSLFAARLADLLNVPVLATDAFLSRRPGPPPGGDHLGHAFDLDALRQELAEGPAHRVTEGVFLEDPRLRPCFDRIVHLRADAACVVERVRARDGEREAAAVRDWYLPAWRAFPAHGMPDRGRLVIDVTRLLEPRLVPGTPM